MLPVYSKEKLALARFGKLFAEIVDVHRQARLVASRGVLVQNSLVDGLVDRRNRGIQQLLRLCFVAGGECRAKLFDLRAETAAVARVDCVALFSLTNSFFG